jgi:hypothetical protein
MKTAEDDFDDLAQEVSRLAAKVLKVDIRASEETSGGDDD